jgi:hypothetical protein
MTEEQVPAPDGQTPGTSIRAHSARLPHDLRTWFKRPDVLGDPLHVCTVVFDPHRYRSRWRLYQDMKLMVAHAGAVLHVAEVAFGDREFVITEPDNPRHLRLRTSHNLWSKENALNLLVQRVLTYDPGAKYLAIVDADVSFARPDWADETRHVLQHVQVAQMWSEAYDLSPDHALLHRHYGLAHCYVNNIKVPTAFRQPYYYYAPGKGRATYLHPGYAWAWRREAWDAVGGLIDFAVLGSADAHMAYSLIGRIEDTIHPDLSERYKAMLRLWGDRADRALKRNLGVVPGLLLHAWHGSKKDRKYISRWKILCEEQFNPDLDLYRDAQGLYQLSDRSWKLRDRIRAYMAQRNEDDIHVD